MQVAEQQSGGLCSPFLCYLLEFPSLPWEETVSQASQVLRCEAQNRAAEYIPSSLQFIFVASATGYLTIFLAHLPLFFLGLLPFWCVVQDHSELTSLV